MNQPAHINGHIDTAYTTKVYITTNTILSRANVNEYYDTCTLEHSNRRRVYQTRGAGCSNHHCSNTFPQMTTMLMKHFQKAILHETTNHNHQQNAKRFARFCDSSVNAAWHAQLPEAFQELDADVAASTINPTVNVTGAKTWKSRTWGGSRFSIITTTVLRNAEIHNAHHPRRGVCCWTP